MKAIDNKELILSLEELEKEKGIKKSYVIEAIETALVTAYKRNFDSLENVKVDIDKQTGATHVYAIKDIMEVAKDEATEISLEDAHKINKSLQLGDQVDVEIVPKDFGRIAAQTAKQVIIQKLREVERDLIFNEFNDRKGEIVSGIIQKADKNIVVMDLGRLEGVMPTKEQVPTEHYNVNDKIKAYVMDVERGQKGAPQVLVSRSHPDFVRKLLELEIPEIYEGVIEIKSVSRDPGYRSKVAVFTRPKYRPSRIMCRTKRSKNPKCNKRITRRKNRCNRMESRPKYLYSISIITSKNNGSRYKRRRQICTSNSTR